MASKSEWVARDVRLEEITIPDGDSGHCLRPDLEAMLEFEQEYRINSRYGSETASSEVLLFCRNGVCEAEPVDEADATIKDGWTDYLAAEFAAVRRLIVRLESKQREAK